MLYPPIDVNALVAPGQAGRRGISEIRSGENDNEINADPPTTPGLGLEQGDVFIT